MTRQRATRSRKTAGRQQTTIGRKATSDRRAASNQRAATATSPFQAEDYLADDRDITEYLNAALQESAEIADDEQAARFFIAALGDAARAERRMTNIARRAGVGRESLYKSLSAESNPSFHTVLSAIRELGGQLSVS